MSSSEVKYFFFFSVKVLPQNVLALFMLLSYVCEIRYKDYVGEIRLVCTRKEEMAKT